MDSTENDKKFKLLIIAHVGIMVIMNIIFFILLEHFR